VGKRDQEKFDKAKAASEAAAAKDKAAKDALIAKQQAASPGKMTRKERQLTKRIDECPNCSGNGCKACNNTGSR
jgi:uncharacterized protein YecA (UPF0149 family)